MTVLNGKLYFGADDGSGWNDFENHVASTEPNPDHTHGRELWVTDGTAGGTVMVKDINLDKPFHSGLGSSMYTSSVAMGIPIFDNKLYFPVLTDSSTTKLCCSDGTSAGTVIVKKVAMLSSDPQYQGIFSTAVFNSKLYFAGYDATPHSGNGVELWATDGTGTGTAMVKDINPLAQSGLAAGWFKYTVRACARTQSRALHLLAGTHTHTHIRIPPPLFPCLSDRVIVPRWRDRMCSSLRPSSTASCIFLRMMAPTAKSCGPRTALLLARSWSRTSI